MSREAARGWLAGVLSLLVPGLGSFIYARRRGMLLLTLSYLACHVVFWSYIYTKSAVDLAAMSVDDATLGNALYVVTFLSAVHLWSMAEAVRDTYGKLSPTVGLTAVFLLPFCLVAGSIINQRAMLNTVFQNVPLATELSQVPLSLSSEELGLTQMQDETVTILLAGSDGGPGRWSRRTDTMVVARLHVPTRSLLLVSVPRNLTKMRFTDPRLQELYPNGFNNIANAVFVDGQTRTDLYPGAQYPGMSMLTDGLSTLLGFPVSSWLMVDMEGFVRVVDAIGGVRIRATVDVEPTGTIPTDTGGSQRFEAGTSYTLNGEQALAYARSRTGNSDYSRMRRQRCVLAALATQASPASLLTNLTELQRTLGDYVFSNVARQDVPSLVRYLGAIDQSRIESVVLAPPVINSADWDPDEVRAIVAHAWAKLTGQPIPTTTMSLPQEQLVLDTNATSVGTLPEAESVKDACTLP